MNRKELRKKLNYKIHPNGELFADETTRIVIKKLENEVIELYNKIHET